MTATTETSDLRPFHLQVIALSHATHGTLWIRRWSAQAAHGMRSRNQLQLLWRPRNGAEGFEARWELSPSEQAATDLHQIAPGLTQGNKQAHWTFTASALPEPASVLESGRVLRALTRATLGRAPICTTRAWSVGHGLLQLSSESGSPQDWSGAHAIEFTLQSERMPRSLFLWSHRVGIHGIQLELAPHVSIAAAQLHREGTTTLFSQLTLQGPPSRLPFQTRFSHPEYEFDLRVSGEGKFPAHFELESPSGVPADTRVSLAPSVETLSGASDGVFPDLFDLSLPLPGAHL